MPVRSVPWQSAAVQPALAAVGVCFAAYWECVLPLWHVPVQRSCGVVTAQLMRSGLEFLWHRSQDVAYCENHAPAPTYLSCTVSSRLDASWQPAPKQLCVGHRRVDAVLGGVVAAGRVARRAVLGRACRRRGRSSTSGGNAGHGGLGGAVDGAHVGAGVATGPEAARVGRKRSVSGGGAAVHLLGGADDVAAALHAALVPGRRQRCRAGSGGRWRSRCRDEDEVGLLCSTWMSAAWQSPQVNPVTPSAVRLRRRRRAHPRGRRCVWHADARRVARRDSGDDERVGAAVAGDAVDRRAGIGVAAVVLDGQRSVVAGHAGGHDGRRVKRAGGRLVVLLLHVAVAVVAVVALAVRLVAVTALEIRCDRHVGAGRCHASCPRRWPRPQARPRPGCPRRQRRAPRSSSGCRWSRWRRCRS